MAIIFVVSHRFDFVNVVDFFALCSISTLRFDMKKHL